MEQKKTKKKRPPPISVLRSSVRLHATHAIGELKKEINRLVISIKQFCQIIFDKYTKKEGDYIKGENCNTEYKYG